MLETLLGSGFAARCAKIKENPFERANALQAVKQNINGPSTR
jgi:hypothetical protein